MDFKEIEAFKKQPELLKQTVNQLIKDFATHGLEIKFAEQKVSPYEELVSQLVPQIEYLLEKNPEKLFAILYSIDLPENKLYEIMHKHTESMALNMAELILKRELQKVVIKNFYSKKTNLSNQID